MKSIIRKIVVGLTIGLFGFAVSPKASAQSGLRMHVPFLPDTPGTWQTFVRLVGAPDVTTNFTFHLFSSDGTPAGKYVYRVSPTSLGAARHVNSDHFKLQGASRGPWSAFIDPEGCRSQTDPSSGPLTRKRHYVVGNRHCSPVGP